MTHKPSSIETVILNNVQVQENGIIRNEKGRLIARLVNDIEFKSEHVKGCSNTQPNSTETDEEVVEDFANLIGCDFTGDDAIECNWLRTTLSKVREESYAQGRRDEQERLLNEIKIGGYGDIAYFLREKMQGEDLVKKRLDGFTHPSEEGKGK